MRAFIGMPSAARLGSRGAGIASNRVFVPAHVQAFKKAMRQEGMAARVESRMARQNAMAGRVKSSMAEQSPMANRLFHNAEQPINLVSPRGGAVNPMAQTMAMASPSAAVSNVQGSMMAGAWRGMGAPSALTGIRAAATSSAGGRMLAGGALGAWTGSDQGTGGMLAGAAAGALLGGAGWNRAAGAVTNMGFTKNWQRMAIGAGGTYFGASAASSMFGNR